MKSCVGIEEFCDDWSVVQSKEEPSYVYMLTEASFSKDEELVNYVQKMNICYDCSINEFSVEDEEEELHYSEEFETDTDNVENSETESLCWYPPPDKNK